MGTIKDGIYFDSQGNPAHRGAVKFDGKIYYAGHDGLLVKDRFKTIHHGMANGLLKHGVYYFDADGVCDIKSYQPSKDGHSQAHKRFQKFKNSLSEAQAILLSVAVLIVGIAVVYFATVGWRTVAAPAESRADQQQIAITLPTYNDEVYLCSGAMQKYYQGRCTLLEAIQANAAYQPFFFRYTIHGAKTATLLLSESKEYAGGAVYDLDPKGSSISIDNLKTGTAYYYRVTAEDVDGKQKTESGTFKTADTNRFVSFSGVYNTRDIGGYNTIYGRKVKQGLLIRGTEMDGLVETSYYLKDVSQVKPFGFVCDFDLRNSDIFNMTYVSRLGENVVHKFYNSPMYGGIFSKGNEATLKQIFTDLADPNNYPMYFHCTYGADRTGTVVFLLQGILGVSEEDMVKEYQLTGFFNKSYASADNIQSVIAGLQGVPGGTINEKVENYLTNTIGITHAQIQSIRNIFLE